jgi:hypothetical protein
MKIILSPIASNKTTNVVVDHTTIIIDGVAIDLSVIPENGYAEPNEDGPFINNITRDTATIKYFYNSAEAESYQPTDGASYTFDIESGPVPCPIIWKLKQLGGQ